MSSKQEEGNPLCRNNRRDGINRPTTQRDIEDSEIKVKAIDSQQGAFDRRFRSNH